MLFTQNIAVAALNDARCEEIAAQSTVDVRSYRIVAHIASNRCVGRARTFSTASTPSISSGAQRRQLHGLKDNKLSPEIIGCYGVEPGITRAIAYSILGLYLVEAIDGLEKPK